MFSRLKRIIRRLLYGVYNPRYYPDVIKKRYLAVSDEAVLFDDRSLEKTTDFYNRYLFKFSPHSNRQKTLRILPCRCIGMDPSEFWSTTELIDREQAFFLHRFYWLNENYNHENHNDIETLVDFWANNLRTQSVAQTPYNTSERIVNCTIFIYQNRNAPQVFIQKLYQIVGDDVRALIQKIEFPYTGVFNNHIINNARAIMWSAMLFGRLDFGKLAQELACYAHKNLFDERGCLCEASFHYQLIVTQRLKEISIIGKDFFQLERPNLNIDQTVSITQHLISILGARSIKTLPLIGDVSPDMPTSLNVFKGLLPEKVPRLSAAGLICYGSWFVLYNSRFLIYLNSHQFSSGDYPHDHGHDDFLSFVLFFDTSPVFIDPGNLSYEDRIYKKFQTSKAHNTIMCDQINTDIVGRTIHSRTGRVNSICLSQFHSSGMVLKRYIHIDEECVFLTDVLLRGQSNDMVYCQFQLGPRVSLSPQEEKSVLVRTQGKKGTLSITGYSQINVGESVSSNSYGLLKHTKKLICYPSNKLRNISRAQISCC
jgi:hypothetical protein